MRYLLIIMLYFISANSHADFIYVPFDHSMYVNNEKELKLQQAEYPFFKKYYESRQPNISNCFQQSIPKTIHQIWIGPKPIPEQYLKLSRTWKRLHPHWNYKLWQDKDVEQWHFASKDLYLKASSYQEKADILRYEILNKYGGLYVDFDYESIKNFDDIMDKYDFFASIEPVLSKKMDIHITNAIIGSKPNNPILCKTLEHIRTHWHSVEKDFFENTKKSEISEKLIHLAVNRTMAPLKVSIKNSLATESCSFVFPPTYMGLENRGKVFDKIKNFFGFQSRRLFFRTTQPETMARQLRGHKRDIINLTKTNPAK